MTPGGRKRRSGRVPEHAGVATADCMMHSTRLMHWPRTIDHHKHTLPSPQTEKVSVCDLAHITECGSGSALSFSGTQRSFPR